MWALWKAFRRSFCSVVLPRLCLISFTFAQPFFIARVLRLLQEVDDDSSRRRGYGLIAATVLIYVGIAVGERAGRR